MDDHCAVSSASLAVLPELCFLTTAPRMQCGMHLPSPMTHRISVELHPATSHNHLTEYIFTRVNSITDDTKIVTIQYNTIQYKTCNAPYVTRMLFVGAGDDTWLGSIGNVKKMSLKFTFKNINRVASSNTNVWEITTTDKLSTVPSNHSSQITEYWTILFHVQPLNIAAKFLSSVQWDYDHFLLRPTLEWLNVMLYWPSEDNGDCWHWWHDVDCWQGMMALCFQGNKMPNHSDGIGLSPERAASEVCGLGADVFRPPCWEDQPCGSIQHGLQSVQEVCRDTGKDRVAIVHYSKFTFNSNNNGDAENGHHFILGKRKGRVFI